MEHAFDLEVKERVIQEKGLEFYEKWLVEDKETRLKIGLTVLYDTISTIFKCVSLSSTSHFA